MAPKQFRIIGGPSKADLMMAFFFKESNGDRRSVVFRLSFPPVTSNRIRFLEELDVIVDDLQWEDGSGESWNWKGHVCGSGQKVLSPEVESYFSTRTRQGWLRTRVGVPVV